MENIFLATTASTGMSLVGFLFPLVIMVLIFWLLIIRPQKKQTQAHNQLLANLKKDDKITTYGGIIGVVKEINEETVIVRTSNSEIELKKAAINQINS